MSRPTPRYYIQVRIGESWQPTYHTGHIANSDEPRRVHRAVAEKWLEWARAMCPDAEFQIFPQEESKHA